MSLNAKIGLPAIVLALAFCAGPAMALPQAARQQVADQAALAAAEILGSGGAAEDAAAVARDRVAASGLAAEVKTLPDKATVTVTLTPSNGNETAIVSTARYRPPEQPPQWAWATRQRFAFKPARVVVGSRCLLNCDQVQE